ncbi:pyrroline-5-carboxylate reductase [Enterococcus sp. LJL99]
MKIGFIGTGNMATAIIQGIVEKEFIKAEEVYLFDVLTDKVNALSKKVNGHACDSVEELIHAVDIVVLAVKPNVVETVLNQTKELILAKQPVLVSIAAGTPLEKIYGYLDTEQAVSIVRVMPNVNAMIGLGAAAVCGNQFASDEQIEAVVELFEAVGCAWKVSEKDFSAFTALAGSSPAYAYLFIDSLARAGVKHGLSKELATQYAAQAVLGSAKMIIDSEENPWTLIDRVCSPGGTTVAGLLALEEEAFIATVVKGIDATIAKDQEMNQK